MKRILAIEEFAMMGISFYFISQLSISLSWWLYLILFFAPDIGMLGYLINTKAGTITYNLFHHKGIAITILFAGLFIHNRELQLTGGILFAHAAFDRILGYGLKYFKGFKYKHLGDLN